jgi:hypothetical protein
VLDDYDMPGWQSGGSPTLSCLAVATNLLSPLARGWGEDAGVISLALAAMVLAAPSADRVKGWETKWLSELGDVKFRIDGMVKLPRNAKSTTQTDTAPVGDQTPATLALVKLPNGVTLMLMERTPKIAKDPAKLEAWLSKTGEIVSSTRHAVGYFIVVKRKDGHVVMGANWAVEPGIDCATEKPVTRVQAEEIASICATFSPLP